MWNMENRKAEAKHLSHHYRRYRHLRPHRRRRRRRRHNCRRCHRRCHCRRRHYKEEAYIEKRKGK